MKKVVKIGLALLAIILVIGLAACRRAPAPVADATPTPPPAATPAPPGEPTPTPEPELPFTMGDDGLPRWHETVTIYAYTGFNDAFVENSVDGWIWEFARQEMNIDFIVTCIPNHALGEQTSLIFASGNLPDVFIGWPTLAQMPLLVRYGDAEGHLRPLQDWVTPDITPSLYAAIQSDPNPWRAVHTADGNVYGLPLWAADPRFSTGMSTMAMFYNAHLLAEVGWDRGPATLNELVEVARALRDANIGDNPDFVPIAGGWLGLDFGHNFFQALGFPTGGNRFLTSSVDFAEILDFHYAPLVAVRAHDAHFEFIYLMRTLLAEGLIHQDYFTKTTAEIQASVAEGNHAFFMGNNTNTLALVDDWTQWRMLPPMTSDRNPNQLWPVFNGTGGMSGAGFHATVAIPDFEMEVAMRFVDLRYHPVWGCVFYFGPRYGIDETWGLAGGWFWEDDIPEGNRIMLDVLSGDFPSNPTAAMRVGPWGHEGNRPDRRTSGAEIAYWDPNDIFGHFRLQLVERMNPHTVFNLFGVLRPPDEQARFTELHQLQYGVNNEAMAGWITGRDPFSREIWEASLADLRAVGLEEFQELLDLGQQRLREDRWFFPPDLSR